MLGKAPLMKHEVSGHGEPLALLPGGLTGWLSWIPHAEKLAASRRVIRLQLLNVEIGLAGAPLPTGYSVDFEATALDRTLDGLAIDETDLAGWSYGSVIALRYALANPHRVRSLTLIEPSAYWALRSRGPLGRELLEEQKFMTTLATPDLSESQLVAFMHVFKFVNEDEDPRALPQWPTWVEHRHSLRIGDIEYRHEESLERVRQFEKPVLLVKGASSNPFVHECIDVLAEELPDARVVSFPGGHAPHIESMGPFLESFAGFLSERKTAPARPLGSASVQGN